MKLEQSFTVAAPVARVWQALVDVERVAPCLPGAQITGNDGQGTYQGTFSVRIGPTTAAYNGTLKMESLDEAAHTAVMSARGTDKRGQGGASATIRSVVRDEGGGSTAVDVVTDFTITGRLARFGRGGMIEDVSKRLLRDFAACLEATVGHEPAPPAATASPPGTTAPPTGGDAAEAPPGPPPPAPLGGPPPGPPPPAVAAPTAGTAEGAPPAPGGPAPATGVPPSPPAARPAPPAAKPVSAFALLRSVLWERLKRLVARIVGLVRRRR